MTVSEASRSGPRPPDNLSRSCQPLVEGPDLRSARVGLVPMLVSSRSSNNNKQRGRRALGRRLLVESIFLEQIGSRDAPSGRCMDHAYLEAIAPESEVPLDQAHQPVHGRVTADRATAAALTVRAR